MSPQCSYFQSWDGKLKIVDRTSRRSKVKYIINRPRYEDELADVVTEIFEILVTDQMRDVSRRACYQVVYGNNSKSLGDEAIAQMRSEKSGSPGNDGDLFRRSRFKHTILEDLK